MKHKYTHHTVSSSNSSSGFLSIGKKVTRDSKFKLPMESNQRKIIVYLVLSIIVLMVLSAIVFVRSREVTTDQNMSIGPSATPTPIPAETIMVTIHEFVPDEMRVRRGTWINFANFSDTVINVSAKGTSEFEKKAFNLGNIANNDVTDAIRFDNPGTYEYYNALKPEQTGKIIVE